MPPASSAPRFDPAAEPVPFATLVARQKFFGAENVDPQTGAVPRGEVHLSWVSVTTFAAALDGHVVLLDTYIHKGEDEENYVPATRQDLIDLQPEYILLGHGHFDHAAGTGEIARATGAVVVGTEQHCNEYVVAAGLDGDPIVSQVPVVQVQEMDSVIKLDSGEAIVMGGLMQDRSTTLSRGVPVLSEIPFVGNAFKGKEDTILKKELVVFLKATIMEGSNLHTVDKDLYRLYSGDRRPLDL